MLVQEKISLNSNVTPVDNNIILGKPNTLSKKPVNQYILISYEDKIFPNNGTYGPNGHFYRPDRMKLSNISGAKGNAMNEIDEWRRKTFSHAYDESLYQSRSKIHILKAA